MAPTFRSIGLRPGGRRYLGSERELRLGVCFWFRLFNVAPETTARFSYFDDRSRNQSPPCGSLSRPRWPAHPVYGSLVGSFSGPAPLVDLLGGPGRFTLSVPGHDQVPLVVELAPLGQGDLHLGLAVLE